MLPERRAKRAARHFTPLAAPWRSRPRCLAFIGALLFTAALHLTIVTGIVAVPVALQRPMDGRGATLNVRALPERVPAAAAEVSARAGLEVAAPVLSAARPAPRRAAPANEAHGATTESAPSRGPTPRDDATASAGSATHASSTSVAPSSNTTAVEPEPSGALPAQDVPIYATRIPPSATLNYRLRRGTLQGTAELRWQHLGERYQAQLHASAAGAPLFRQSSEGGLEGFGLAPERFTDQRARRGMRAISFQRESGRVSFSAVQGTLDLGAGMQDRLSWIAQLAAVASANPDLLAAGGEIVLLLVGTRGDSVPWRFVSLGAAVDAEADPFTSIHLRRLPASAYDTSVEVWLDPAPPHWPVRAEWRNGPADPGLELRRVEKEEAR
jgi:hypothetical protein